MNTTNFNRAKAIEAEIVELKSYVDAITDTSTEDRKIHLKIEGRGKDGQYHETAFGPSFNSCPQFLKEQILDDLNFVADRIVQKVNRHIVELEKEFETL